MPNGQKALQAPINQQEAFLVRQARIEGMKEAIKEIEKEKRKSNYKLNELLNKSNQGPLFKLSTFWPLKFFPAHVVIENDRINISSKEFINSGGMISLSINIIQEINIESGPLFSNIKFITIKPTEPIVSVKYLKKKDAIKARRIVQGLIIAHRNGVHMETIDPKELAYKVEELGKTMEAEGSFM